MPKGPQGQKRPADVIGNAVLIMRIATGDTEESAPTPKNLSAQTLGAKGGIARANNLSKKKRKDIAKKAAQARWAKK